jgi:hypothetical protein
MTQSNYWNGPRTMNFGKYILNDNGNPVLEPDLIKWAMWFETATNRRVAKEMIGEVQVSTVFLGLDHNFCSKGPPIVWETMVFGGELDQETERCSGNREQAEAMHQDMVERVKSSRTFETLKSASTKFFEKDFAG